MGSYKIFAFVVNDKNKFTYVGVLAEKDGVKSVYYVKGYFENRFIELNKNRELLEKEGFVFIRYSNFRNDLEIAYYPKDDPIMELKTNGTATFKGHTFPKIQYTKMLDTIKSKEHVLYTEEDRYEIDNVVLLKMQPIIGKIKLIGCKRLEELQEGLQLIISNLSTVNYRGKRGIF